MIPFTCVFLTGINTLSFDLIDTFDIDWYENLGNLYRY